MMSMDGKKDGQNQKKVNAIAAEMTATSESRFAKMSLRDRKVVQAIVLLFLAG